ncbi:MAG: MarR family transcriptional regulator [Solirubrobacteraceae bacterium]|nr:MarR family transcriptional regulator [Solirubrobacteraceae bacterium]
MSSTGEQPAPTAVDAAGPADVTAPDDVEPLVPAFLVGQTSCVLVKIGQVVLRLVDRRLAPLGLRLRHYSLLSTVIEQGPLSQQDLVVRLRIDKATMVSCIDLLEGAGLVERHRTDTDRKRYAIVPTDRGRAVAAEADALLHALDAEVLADLDAAEHAALHTAIETLNAGPALPAAYDRTRE